MAKHYKWPKDCSRCGLCGRPSMFDLSSNAERIKCPMVATDTFDLVDWDANGWPDPIEFDKYHDASNMPDEIYEHWLEISCLCYEAYREGL